MMDCSYCSIKEANARIAELEAQLRQRDATISGLKLQADIDAATRKSMAADMMRVLEFNDLYRGAAFKPPAPKSYAVVSAREMSLMLGKLAGHIFEPHLPFITVASPSSTRDGKPIPHLDMVSYTFQADRLHYHNGQFEASIFGLKMGDWLVVPHEESLNRWQRATQSR